MLKVLRLTILMMLFCVSAFAADTYKFTDMAGRTVDMPKQVSKVFSTNPIGTLYLYAIAPEKIAGINWPITPMEKNILRRNIRNCLIWAATSAAKR